MPAVSRIAPQFCIVAVSALEGWIGLDPNYNFPIMLAVADLFVFLWSGYKIPVIENLGATLDQFDAIDFSDNEIRKLDGFPLLKRLKTLLMNNNRLRWVLSPAAATLQRLWCWFGCSDSSWCSRCFCSVHKGRFK